MDYVIVQCFLGRDNAKPVQHISDSRFRGVYISDSFVLALQTRRAVNDDEVLAVE